MLNQILFWFAGRLDLKDAVNNRTKLTQDLRRPFGVAGELSLVFVPVLMLTDWVEIFIRRYLTMDIKPSMYDKQ